MLTVSTANLQSSPVAPFVKMHPEDAYSGTDSKIIKFKKNKDRKNNNSNKNCDIIQRNNAINNKTTLLSFNENFRHFLRVFFLTPKLAKKQYSYYYFSTEFIYSEAIFNSIANL